MKAIMLNREHCEALTADTDALMMSDSAIVNRGRPVFLPLQLALRWAASPCIAARIGRLGKSIAPKFVHRYVDAIAPAMALSRAGGSPRPCLDACVDGALALGEWAEISLDQYNNSAPLRVNIQIDMLSGQTLCSQTLQIGDWADEIAQAVAYVSATATLKTGDIVIASALSAPVVVEPNVQACISLPDLPAAKLLFRYK